MEEIVAGEALFLLVFSIAVLVVAIRMKVPPYDEVRSPIASVRRALKYMGLTIGIGGILASLLTLFGG